MTRLLGAEIRKLWTIWSTYVLFGIVVVIDLAFGFGLALAPGGRHGGSAGVVPHGSSQWFINVFSVLDVSRILALVLGAIIITGEYRHKTVTPTFLAEPRRGRVVTAKLGISFGSGVVLGALTMVTGLVLGFVLVAMKVHSCLTPLGVSQGMSQALCGVRHGVYYVATTHNMWHDWSRIAPGVVLGTFRNLWTRSRGSVEEPDRRHRRGSGLHPGRGGDRRRHMADDRRVPPRTGRYGTRGCRSDELRGHNPAAALVGWCVHALDLRHRARVPRHVHDAPLRRHLSCRA